MATLIPLHIAGHVPGLLIATPAFRGETYLEPVLVLTREGA